MAKIDKTYHNLLRHILENGKEKADRTRTGTLSVFGVQLRHDMGDGFPLLTTKKLHTKSIIYELLWFLKGDTNTNYLRDNGVSIWDEWADKKGDLGPVYGKQWVDWGGFEIVSREIIKGHNDGINQIQNAIDLLKLDPDSRRIMISAWNVGELNEMALQPCHYGFQLYSEELGIDEWGKNERINWAIKNNFLLPNQPLDWTNEILDKFNVPKRKLNLMWNQRSVDTFLGLPFNIASYGLLLHMFAQQVGMVPGELIGNLGDTHLYTNHLGYVEKQLERNTEKYEAPQLILNKADDIFSYNFSDFQIQNYETYPNWKNVPIAV